MHCAHRNPAVPPIFDSAMIVKDSLVHEVDVTRFLFDEEIASIQIIKPAAESRCTTRDLHDPQIAILRTESGKHVDVEVFVTTGVAYEVRTEVVGREGQRHDRTRRRPGAQERTRQLGRPHHPRLPGTLRTGLRHRVPALGRRGSAGATTGDYTDGPDAWDGYAAAAVCEAGVQSLKTGRPSRSRWSTRASIKGA